jgi:ubiquinone/menaquinone biosynthesis C-methylase UbiE/uncharacterized protein YbaR (Trm112 family)
MSMNYLKIIACPDCGARLSEITADGSLVGFCCQDDGIIFPLVDGIPILLAREKRSHKLEYSLIENIRQEVSGDDSSEFIATCIERTLNLLEQSKHVTTYECEEDEYWTNVYSERAVAVATDNWNHRIWLEEFLVQHLVEQTSLRGKVILDVGCGEGQSFRFQLSQYCDESTLYIAADISLSGLKLNRCRNPHENSLYILCSAEHLPIQKGVIDVLCYFGILHHTQKKAANIYNHLELLKSDGYMLMYEGLQRPSRLRGLWEPGQSDSPHEERIEREQLEMAINESGLEIVCCRYFNTIFYGSVMHFFRSIVLNNKGLFNLVLMLDNMFMKILGGVIRYFRPGTIMLLLKRQKVPMKPSGRR